MTEQGEIQTSWVVKLIEKMRDRNLLTWNLGLPIDSSIHSNEDGIAKQDVKEGRND